VDTPEMLLQGCIVAELPNLRNFWRR